MRNFTIAELERFSGIKAHTFRTWEQRYHFFKPARTATNFRYYTIKDVRQLLNITLLNKCGYKVSKLDKLTPAEITELAGKQTEPGIVRLRQIHELIIYMFQADVERFESTLTNCINLWGINMTIEEVILPFLDKTPVLSYDDTSNEVHLAVTIIRKKIIFGIERSSPLQRINKKVLLFLPEREHYDLTLLYLNYVLKREGYNIVYMGTNISTRNLESIVISQRPDLLVTYIVHQHQLDIHKTSELLRQHLPDSLLVVSGFTDKLSAQELPMNVSLSNYKHIRNLLLTA